MKSRPVQREFYAVQLGGGGLDLTKMADVEAKSVEFSQIKNRIRRSALYRKEKLRKAKEKRERKRKRKREESQGQDEVR